MADIEYQTICRTLRERNFDALEHARITSAFFLDPDNAAVFDWMKEHWSKYQESPSEEAFHREYPADQLIETAEPLAYYIDELRDQRRYAMLNDMLDGIKEPLNNNDTDIAVRLLAAGLEGLQLEVTELLDEWVNDTGEERMSYYQSLTTRADGLLGWPTGFPSMDQATSGLQKGQLITMAGTTKVKKSMLLMCMTIAANQAGAKAMYVSFEMSNREQTTRHDALRAGISLTRLQHGRHTPEEHRKLKVMIHEVESRPALVMVHDPTSTTTVSAIRAKIAQHRPDVVYIDGAYMMECEDPGITPNSPQALTSITRSLKRLAQQTDVPIVQTTQALTWKTPKGKLSVNSIGYSSSFGQDSDVVFGVEAILGSDGQINDRETLLRILASRNCSPRDVRLIVDLDRGYIVEGDDAKFEADDDEDDG
jgi:archaellum biogenesis ATPase FlaH